MSLCVKDSFMRGAHGRTGWLHGGNRGAPWGSTRRQGGMREVVPGPHGQALGEGCGSRSCRALGRV